MPYQGTIGGLKPMAPKEERRANWSNSWLGGTIDALTGKAQTEIEQQNLSFQEATLDYQKQLQEKIFSREDTAVQRRAADLEAAGLSPVLAAGSDARAGAPIPISTPQRGIQGLNIKANLVKEAADITKTLAESAFISAQTTGKKTENEYANRALEDRLKIIHEQGLQAVSETQITAARRFLTQAEETDRQALYKYLNEQYPGPNGIGHLAKNNPAVYEYLAGSYAMDLAKTNADWASTLNVMKASSPALSLLIPILKIIMGGN